MRKLIVFALALLLMAVVAGLSPPVKKQSAQTAVAKVTYENVTQAEATRADFLSQNKMIIATVSGVSEANPYKQIEVAAVARAGSQNYQNPTNSKTFTRFESDIGTVLLL